MWNLKKVIIGLLIFILVLLFGVFLIVFNSKVTISALDVRSGVSILNNSLTPVITLVAVVVYYVTLKYIQRQTEQQKDDSKILQGDYFFKYLNDEIPQLEKDLTMNSLLVSLIHVDEKIFNEQRNVFFHEILNALPLVQKAESIVLQNQDYLKMIKHGGSINAEDLVNKEWFSVYNNLLNYYDNVNRELTKVMHLIYKVDSNKFIHETHKSLLVEKIIKRILSEYIQLIESPFINNFKLILFEEDLGKKTIWTLKYGDIKKECKVLDYFKIKDLYKWVKLKYPDLVDEVTYRLSYSDELFSKLEEDKALTF